MAKKIRSATGMDELTWCKFSYSFFLCCQLNQGVAALHTNKDISSDMLMDTKEYNKAWKKISRCGEIRTGGERTDPLWQKIESIFNEAARSLLMSDNPELFYVIVLDDDTVHFEWKRFTNTQGLKRARHVKANARGFVLQVAANTASGVPIQVAWMKEGDTEESCYRRIVGKLFGQASGENNRPKIQDATFESDRGYRTGLNALSSTTFSHQVDISTAL
jgi:hypothetical protein